MGGCALPNSGVIQRPKEPAWHRRERAQRSLDRALVRTHKAGARLAAHHGSCAGSLPVEPMAWGLSQKQQQDAFAAMAAFLVGTKGGGKGASGGSKGGGKGKKDGIPNWDCKCGHTANWGTRPVCKDCGAEAPKWVLKLQAEKGTKPPPPKGSGKGSPNPPAQPSASNPTGGSPGASRGQGEWRREGKAGRTEPEAPPSEDNEAETTLRSQLEIAKSTLRSAKNQGADEDTLEFLQRKVDRLQTTLDALKPLDSRLRSLLDQKKAAEGKVASTESKVAAAKEALKEAEQEESAAKARLQEIGASIEEVRQQQQSETEAQKPRAEQHQRGDEIVVKLSENGLPEASRQMLLATLELLGISAKQAADRGLELANQTAQATKVPEDTPPADGSANQQVPMDLTGAAAEPNPGAGLSAAEIKALRKRQLDSIAAMETLEHAATAVETAERECKRLREAEEQAKTAWHAADDPADHDTEEFKAHKKAAEATAAGEAKRQRLVDAKNKAAAQVAEVSKAKPPAAQ